MRKLLNGSFANTAFCVLTPDGEERLSRSGRSPLMAFSKTRRPPGEDGDDEVTVPAMEEIAKKYIATGDPSTPVVQDFQSFRQSLNVASGDQRLLLYVATPEDKQSELRKRLSPVMGDEKIIGRFHTDFYSKDADEKWADVITGEDGTTGLFIIQSGQFGQKGKVMTQLPLDAKAEEITSALLKANETFSETESRKVYSEHVAEGRKEGVHFETNMPYGEDRDGDGKIDERRGRKGAGSGERARRPKRD